MTAPQWRRASSCTSSGNCVEVAPCPGGVVMRDSKRPDGPVLVSSVEAFAVLLAAVKAGVFDDML